MTNSLKDQFIIQRVFFEKGNIHKKNCCLSLISVKKFTFLPYRYKHVVKYLDFCRRFATRNKLFINLRASISDFLSLLAPMRPFKVSFNLLLKVLQASKVAFRSESILSENYWRFF